MAPCPDTEPADTVIRIVLFGLAQGLDFDDIAPQVAALASDRRLFPGDALFDLTADVIEVSGATRERLLDTEQIRQRLLPEDDEAVVVYARAAAEHDDVTVAQICARHDIAV